MPELITKIVKHRLEPEQFHSVYTLLDKALHPKPTSDLATLERSEREDELAAWLDHYDIEESWVIAETLVETGLTTADLNALTAQISKRALPDIIIWIEDVLNAKRMLENVGSAVGRISDLVAAVKTYSHMDRASDKHSIDVHKGLENTLTMLNHKLKKNNIRVTRKYQADLPPIPVYVGELNQMWTNLIDNAIDAMHDGGELRICTELEDTCIAVKIIDNGPGIPAEIQTRLFEPFFTTKEVGEGTGLGLDIVQRIVTQHHGDIRVASESGRTEFTVRLPLKT
jgi:signal transduction histidine kinase